MMGQEMEGEGSEVKFPAFPFKPYSIQVDFMKALYESLDKGGIAMLESPTGTGKTLSIICSALQWLVNRKKDQNSGVAVDSSRNSTTEDHEAGSDNEPDWMRDFVADKGSETPEKKVKNKKRFGFRSKKKSDKSRIEESFKDLWNCSGVEDIAYSKKEERKDLNAKMGKEEVDDKEFLVDDYESEDEGSAESKRKASGVSVSSSSDDEEEGECGVSDEEEEAAFKIYFCSRTHSQLSQFIKELRKTVFASQLKVVSLGSRKNFCINEDVLKLGNSTRINEQCLELQKNNQKEVSKMKKLGVGGRVRRTKASCGCPMLSKHKLQKQFKNEISQQGPLDIEELVHLGDKLRTCPYYGSRSMVPAADLVVLPYQSLLSKSSRESLGLDLQNSVVIIDEAHNLADSLISMYDSKITLSQLELVHSNLEGYLKRFRNLLGPDNRRYIQTLMVLTRAFLQTLCNNYRANNADSSCEEGIAGGKTPSDCSVAINEFLFSLNIDNINLVKLLQYIKESNIIHKVTGYGDKNISQETGSSIRENGDYGEEGSSLSGFRALVGMLLSLTNNDGDGRIIISRPRPNSPGQQGGYLKYVMLTGEKIFHEIAKEAHAVILAGGTLQPIDETRERLFPWLPPDQLHFFSCGHIVPSENILPIAVSCGPTGRSLDFSYSSRSTSVTVDELGLLLCNLVTVVPEGIIVFFSSFDYEGHVYDAWKASGIVDRIMKKKRVFREPRRNTEVEVVLKAYKETIDESSTNSKDASPPHNGAIFLAVVGGKISEGINFSDGMGRCIVMVGLPYPNPSDLELMERVKHIEGLGDANSIKKSNSSSNNECLNGNVQAGFDILRRCKRRGREYYENLCMKAVNQSIGRAIRHINDYAAILLVDTRYAPSSKPLFSQPTNKLPQWIKGRLVSTTANYGEVHRLLYQFFKFNKNKVSTLAN